MREGDMTRKQKMKQVVCPNCGGSHELPVGYQITNHKNVSVCLGILPRRAEEAEAERDDLRDANGVLSEALEAARQTLEALTARVAELEAARRFKRGYPDKPGMYIVRRADGTVGTARYYTDGWNWGAFNTDITQWAEMPEEPTP